MPRDSHVILQTSAQLGEGAIWDGRNQRLLWVDILGKIVGRLDPASGRNETFPVGSLIGTVVPSVSGALRIAVQEGFACLDPVTGLVTDNVCPAGHDASLARFNDGKCDPAGRFLAGTMSLTGILQAGALYALETDGRSRTVLTGVSISNGLVWSLDGTVFYYIDTPTGTVAAFDYDLSTGALHHRRTAVEIPESHGFPDGMTIDAEGMLWIALWGGSGVLRCNPKTGGIIEKIHLPASLVTSCAFGGPGLATLFVTTARCDLPPMELAQQPLAGSIFALDAGTTGVPASCFGS